MESKISLNLIKNWQSLCFDIVFSDIAPLLLQNRVITVDEYQHIVSHPKTAMVESLLLLLLKKDEDVLLKFGKSLENDYGWLAEKLKEGYTIQEVSRDETDSSPITRLESDKDVETDALTEDEKSVNDMCKDCHNLNAENKTHRLNNSFSNKRGSLGRRKIIKAKNRLNQKLHYTENLITSTTELIKPVLNEELTDEAIAIVRRSSLVSKSWTTIAHSLSLTDRVNEIRYKVVLHGEDLSMCIVYLLKDWIERFPKIATLSKLIEVLRSEGYNDVADKLTDILYNKKNNKSHTVC